MAEPFPFTLADLNSALGSGVIDRALDVVKVAPARITETSRDGSRLSAVVQSSTGRGHYQVTIALSRLAGRLRVNGYCTCRIGQSCKHIGATLLTSLAAGHGRTAPDDQEADSDTPRDGGDSDGADDPVDAFDDLDFDDMERRQRLAAPPPVPRATSVATLSPSGPGLSAAARQWLDRLGSAVRPLTPAPAKSSSRRLAYVLDRALSESQWGLWAIVIKTTGVARDGALRLTDQRVIDPEHADRLINQNASYLTADDAALLRDLAWLKRQTPYNADIVLRPGLASTMLVQRMAALGRLHHGGVDGPALTMGPERTAAAAWQSVDQSRQKLTFVAEEGAAFDAVVALDPPHYISAGIIGPIAAPYPPRIALEVARAPSISRVESGLVRADLERLASPLAPAAIPASDDLFAQTPAPPPAPLMPTLPLPVAVPRVETRRIAPVTTLRLFLSDVRLKDRFRSHAPEAIRNSPIRLPLAALSFDYAGERVVAGDPRTSLEIVDGDGVLTIVPRDRDREDTAAQWLRALRFIPTTQAVFDVQGQPDGIFWLRPPPDVDAYRMLTVLSEPDRYIAFSTNDVPRLEKSGWRVVFDPDYPYRIANGVAEWWADIGDGARIDWFSFALGITYEGHRVNLVPQLASLLERLPAAVMDLARKPNAEKAFTLELAKLDLFAQLPDGRLLRMPADRMAPILRNLVELIGPRADRISDGRIALHRAEATAIATLADSTPVAWAANARALVDLGNDLKRGRTAVPVTPPATFLATLRPYQQEGLAWLAFLREAGFGGCLADDMGLGKTVQTLAFLAHEKASGRLTRPALIVAPTSVLPNWQAEAERFAPDLSVLMLRGPERKELFQTIASHDLVLTTYPLLARDHETLLKETFHVAILDEAQAIKNPKATVSGIAQRIKARHRFALTGTPLENNLGEVWSLFAFLSPGLLGDQTSFKRHFQTPIEKHGDRTAQTFLSRRLKPFLLRRTKAEVAKELPPKTQIVERIDLEGAQRDLYETVRVLMEKRVRAEIDKKGLAKSHIIFLDALLKLRQICCDPRLLAMEEARRVKQSAKRERLMAMLPEMVAEGRKILLFSQFTSMLDLIEADLKREKIPFVTLRGDTDDRAKPVRAFQAGDVPVFLLSLKAGGTGLNLTAADTVIHYDPWWNPAVENQATDRAYRIGQAKPVFVYKLLVSGSIEEAIELLKQKKTALADALYASDAGAPFKLTEADIAALFAPMGNRR